MSESGSTEDESEVSSVALASFTEGPEFMTKDLIAMILQYMEASGLHDSYKSLWTECESFGYPMPSEGQSVLLESVEFGPREANLLFKYFDLEEKEKLLAQWTRFIQAIDPEQQDDFQKITFFVRIFAATIPFRKDEAEEEKSKALSELREFFQEKTDEFSTDEKMLSLFALPFIADPASHPVFKEIFQDAWKTKLRSQVSLSIKKFCEFKNLPTIGSTDLVQLYLAQQEDFMDAAEDNKSGCSEPMSGRRTAHHHPTLQSLHQNLKSTESTLLDVELRYHKLLKVTAEMVGALESAVQGKEQNMAGLRNRVTSVFPELFKAFRMDSKVGTRPDTESDASYAGSESEEDSKVLPKSGQIVPDIDEDDDEDVETHDENNVSQEASPMPSPKLEKSSPQKGPPPTSQVDSSRSSKTRAVVIGNKAGQGRNQSRDAPKVPLTPHRIKGGTEAVQLPPPPPPKKVATKAAGRPPIQSNHVERSKSQTRKKVGPATPSSGSKTQLSRKGSNLGVQQR